MYDLNTIVKISQHTADKIPTHLIVFSLLLKNDIITLTDAIIGNIENIPEYVIILATNNNPEKIVTKVINNVLFFFVVYFSIRYIVANATNPITLHTAPVTPLNK